MPYHHSSPRKMTKDLTIEVKKKKKTKAEIFVMKKKKLSKAQEDALKKHSIHHTKAHIDLMKKLMLEGKTFKQSHMEAMKKHPPKNKKKSK